MQKSHLFDHLILIVGTVIIILPVLALILTSTQENAVIAEAGLVLRPGGAGLTPYRDVLMTEDLFANGFDARDMLINSTILALGFAVLKTLLCLLAAYALVCFRLPAASLWFGLILLPLFFPIETRVMPTFLVTHHLGLLDSYAGMILPIVASGLGVLVFRQFLLQLPNELFEAAKLDGAGPIRVLADIVVPLSLPMVGALFSILFVIGWNQYLWPLMMTPNSEAHYTIVRGIQRVGTGSNTGMAMAVLALLPPVVVMLIAQRWILRGFSQVLH